MVEVELKFQVPAAQRAAVAHAVDTASARTTRLRAQYFDTPDRRLAAAGLALRLRQEGRHWRQTLKGSGDGGLLRLEHEVPVAARRGGPRLDVARHAGTPAAAALTAALGDQAAALRPVFETDVRRTHRSVRVGGARIEIAFDLGVIRADAAQAPLCEIEFELQSGPLAGLLQLATRWTDRHALWLDVRSKAERGDLLTRGQRANPPTVAQPPDLSADMSTDTALRAMVRACLAQILPNIAALAADCGEPEHLHQARVGLRRLDTALREFAAWSPAVDAAWQARLKQCFAPLGAVRDADAIAEWVQPALLAAEAPWIDPALDAKREALAAVLREPDVTRLMLTLIAFAHTADPAPAPTRAPRAPQDLARQATHCLARLHGRVVKDGSRFVELDSAARHRMRRRLKRLRYALEFFALLLPGKPLRRFVAQLRPAQDALGRLNDAALAEAAFRRQLASEPRAWFALRWLAAQRAQWLQDAATALAKLGSAKPGWPQHRGKR